MKRFIIIICFSFLLIPSVWAVEPKPHDGNMLLNACTSALKEKLTDNSSVSDASWCIGYLQGIGSLKVYYDVMSRKGGNRLFYCVPDNVPVDQKIRVVVKFLNDHPERLHELAIVLTIEALQQAFPCK